MKKEKRGLYYKVGERKWFGKFARDNYEAFIEIALAGLKGPFRTKLLFGSVQYRVYT